MAIDETDRAVRSKEAVDYRSRRSPSFEGRSIARRARDEQLARLTDLTDDADGAVEDPADALAALRLTDDLLGFWVLWHLLGGFEALERYGMHRSTIWRKVARFRTVTGEHPDEFSFHGVEFDVERFWSSFLRYES